MKPPIPLFVAALVMVAPVVTGCAGEDAEAGEAAYPPIGYTPPDQAPQASVTPPPAPPVRATPMPSADGPPGEVAIGADEEVPPDDGAGDSGGYADVDPAALSDFRSTLEPYGSWTDDLTYGTVWVPSSSVVGDDFTPYVSAGHWAYDSDYAWVSDYDWGWAPFHYGRWVYGGPGWEWIPGHTYAGVWVSWRTGVNDWGYVGWAPLAPTWCWRGGVAVGLGFVPRAPYAFVGTGELFHPNVGSRVIAGPQVASVAAHTRPYASPAAGGRVAAHPSVAGPPPSDLHISPDAVSRASVDNRGLTQARAFSRPSTAMALGARAPTGTSFAARTAPTGWSQTRTLGAGSSASRSYAAYPSSSHFGGRLGGGFAGSAAYAAPMRSPTTSYGSARPYFGSAPRYSSPSTSFRGGSPPATFRSSPSFGGGARSAPSFSGGSHAYSGGSFHGGGSSGFHGGGGGGGHSGGHR